MFYGIYGDSDGDNPEVIGEASWLMARTCFPNDDLNGNNGHVNADVTCKFNDCREVPKADLYKISCSLARMRYFQAALSTRTT